MLHSGGHNQHWPTSGRIGYINPALWEVPNASQWETRSALAHKWADWRHNPCRLGGPQHFTAGDTLSIGPRVDGLAT